MMLITMPKVLAKRSLGQNWLVNPGVLDRIVAAAGVGPADTVLEIGPGTGALTARLAATGAAIVAVEKDRRLVEPLRAQFADRPNVRIVEGDILELDPVRLELPPRYKVVANIPYYLTSYLIRRMLEEWPQPQLAVLMVQREVAQRITATPPAMNLLGLAVQLYATPHVVMRVSRGSFRPMPDVDSAVVLLEPTGADRASNERVLALARTAFGQKRKQLATSIPADALAAAGIVPTARPQELSVDDWRKLGSVAR